MSYELAASWIVRSSKLVARSFYALHFRLDGRDARLSIRKSTAV